MYTVHEAQSVLSINKNIVQIGVTFRQILCVVKFVVSIVIPCIALSQMPHVNCVGVSVLCNYQGDNEGIG